MAFRKGTSISIGTYLTRVEYDLPSTLKSLRSGWLTTFQSSAVVAALFAGIEIVLLAFVKTAFHNGDVKGDSRSGRALLTLTYLALFFSLSAAMSSLVLIDELGTIAVRASRSIAAGESTLTHSEYDEGINSLLTRFNGGRKAWRWVLWHWLFTLVVGFICLIGQLVLYAWCTETTGIEVGVLVMGAFSTFPLSCLFLQTIWLKKREQEDLEKRSVPLMEEPQPVA